MRLFHISDLHIGKQLHTYNLKESQQAVFSQIISCAKVYRPDAILIAGDIYDKSVPSGESFEVFDDFLNQLADIEPAIPVLIIAGNHDNASRLNFASSFLKKHQIYLSVFTPKNEEEHLEKITLTDEFGEVDFYLLPFTKPAYVRHLFEEGTITDYHSAIEGLIHRESIDFTRRNVLVAHQFFVSQGKEPQKSDSELPYLSVGGLDSVDVSCVKDFDYVALGHIHRPQKIGADHIRYSGTPYKYSVSEEHDEKGILMVTIGEKGSANEYTRIPLQGKPDVRSIRGTLSEVISLATPENKDDYVSVTLTDEKVSRPKEQLEEHYSHLLELRMDNGRTKGMVNDLETTDEVLDPVAAFQEFYREMNGRPMDEEEEALFLQVMDQARGEEEAS